LLELVFKALIKTASLPQALGAKQIHRTNSVKTAAFENEVQ